MNQDVSFTVRDNAKSFEKSSLCSARILGHGLTYLAMAILKNPSFTESVALRHTLDVFEQANTAGKPPTEDDGKNFIAAVQSMHRMQATLRVNEKGLLVLAFECYLENEPAPFFEWIIQFEQDARIHGSEMTQYTLNVG